MWHIIWNAVAVCSLILNALFVLGIVFGYFTDADENRKYPMFRQEVEWWAYKYIDNQSKPYHAFQELLARYDKMDGEA